VELLKISRGKAPDSLVRTDEKGTFPGDSLQDRRRVGEPIQGGGVPSNVNGVYSRFVR
jgi:hypothetical protein